jgi:hypothetical protein
VRRHQTTLSKEAILLRPGDNHTRSRENGASALKTHESATYQSISVCIHDLRDRGLSKGRSEARKESKEQPGQVIGDGEAVAAKV